MKAAIGFITLCCAALHAGDFQRFALPNGAAVLYQGWREPAGAFWRFPRLSQSGNAIRRTVTADSGAILVAFDVQVDVLPANGGFRLRFTPVAGEPFFARAPEPRVVQPGDYVLVDVLEQPATGKRMFDSLKVGFRDTPMTLLPFTPDVPRVVATGSVLTLDRPELRDENGRPIANTTTKISGTQVALQASENGRTVRFTLSTGPAPGFRLEAVIYGQKPRAILAFTDGELVYYISGASAMLPATGPSMLWVRKEGNDPPGRHLAPLPDIDARQPGTWPPPHTASPGVRRTIGQLFVTALP